MILINVAKGEGVARVSCVGLVSLFFFGTTSGGSPERDERRSQRKEAPDANSMTSFGIRSYCHFIRGEDDAVSDLDLEFLGKLEAEKANVAETISTSEHIAGELEGKLDHRQFRPPLRI